MSEYGYNACYPTDESLAREKITNIEKKLTYLEELLELNGLIEKKPMKSIKNKNDNLYIRSVCEFSWKKSNINPIEVMCDLNK